MRSDLRTSAKKSNIMTHFISNWCLPFGYTFKNQQHCDETFFHDNVKNCNTKRDTYCYKFPKILVSIQSKTTKTSYLVQHTINCNWIFWCCINNSNNCINVYMCARRSCNGFSSDFLNYTR